MTSPVTPRPLSPKQLEVFAFVKRYFSVRNSSPTLHDIVLHCNVRTVESARAHLQKIARKGWITFDATVEQGIAIVEATS